MDRRLDGTCEVQNNLSLITGNTSSSGNAAMLISMGESMNGMNLDKLGG